MMNIKKTSRIKNKKYKMEKVKEMKNDIFFFTNS